MKTKEILVYGGFIVSVTCTVLTFFWLVFNCLVLITNDLPINPYSVIGFSLSFVLSVLNFFYALYLANIGKNE